MKKSTKGIMIGIWAAVFAAASVFGVLAVMEFMKARPAGETLPEGDDGTFAVYSDYEVFARVPRLSDPEIVYEKALDDGDNTYGIRAFDVTEDHYRGYLKTLEQAGFKKFADNGADGLEGAIYKTYFTKEDMRLSVTFIKRMNGILISVSESGEWSEHLLYADSYVAENVEGEKTKLYLPELYALGASFYVQLKNGHFILNDGGINLELKYLLDDLERLAPEGEKPVVEAWFISHPHTDHMGIFQAFLENQELLDRIYVENVYFDDYGKEALEFFRSFDSDASLINYVRSLPKMMKSSDGSAPKTYEVSAGDRFYFNDLSIEVPYSSEMLPYDEWLSFNGASLWLMYRIEGQKALLSFDGTWPTQKFLMKAFDRSYFDLDLYSTPHHGYDVFNEFSNYLTRVGTLLYTNYHTMLGDDTGYSVQSDNLRVLNEIAEETYTFGNGTVVLEFPYTVGSAETLEPREWVYNAADPVR